MALNYMSRPTKAILVKENFVIGCKVAASLMNNV